MPLFRIATSGPLLTVRTETLDDAVARAARNMPLKSTWTTERTYSTDGRACTLRARNRNGRVVNAFRIRQLTPDEVTEYDRRDAARRR